MRNFKMIFRNDEELLKKMLNMRRKGWTYVSLAFIFGVDHSSIYKWCKIYHIPNPKDTETLSINVSSLISNYGYQGKVLKVRTYADYCEEERRRTQRNRLKMLS